MTERAGDVRKAILTHVPQDGSTIGNQSLLTALRSRFPDLTAEDYQAVRDTLIAEGVLAKGRGQGGSVYRVDGEEGGSGAGRYPAAPDRDGSDEALDDISIGFDVSGASTKRKAVDPAEIVSYRHKDSRANNPEVGMVHPSNDPDSPKTKWAYDPHIDPALQFDVGRSSIERLIDDALAGDDPAQMREALAELKRLQAPYLNWTGKAERTSFEVDTVSLHVHERVDPATILDRVRKAAETAELSEAPPHQPDLFDPPFAALPLRQALDFYKHEKNWSNRLIAGDSLLVMNSLLQKEGMAGQVQMIYIDPPYGIKYGSNFQPFVNKREVKDGSDGDLTQEPEMIKAFRDTWELGIHSYLTYLRDRLLLCKDLLHSSGSVFVQISDDNLHHVKSILDEIFSEHNRCTTILMRKSGWAESIHLPQIHDFILWYAKDKKHLKFNRLYTEKKESTAVDVQGVLVKLPNGSIRQLSRDEKENLSRLPDGYALLFHDNLTSEGQSSTSSGPISFEGDDHWPGANKRTDRHWKTTPAGISRLAKAGRLMLVGRTLRQKRFLRDFPLSPITDHWDDTAVSGFSDPKVYVVQTNTKAAERCLLMTTDPGDLVLDPTCGSGTTALVAEKWGRRWITCDTSRVATTLAKQRLMTGSFDYYGLRYAHEGLKGGFIYETVPHVTLRSVANNPDIDAIYNRMHPAIEAALRALNGALATDPPSSLTPTRGVRKAKKVIFRGNETLHEWEVPFDWPKDWPQSARAPFDAFHEARQAMQREMDASIAAHADHDTLYDRPEVDPKRLRITGPFTVEAVPTPTVRSLDDVQPAADADASVARTGETSRQALWRDELMKTGIRGKSGGMLRFAELETIPGLKHLHASGSLAETGERVVVSFGPEHAALEQRQVALALDEAERLRPAPRFIVFCAFTFDPEAAKDIDEVSWAGVTLLKAQMNTDLLTEDLKRARASNESFWLMGQPDVELRPHADGTWEVEVHGFDYFDPKAGELVSGGKSRIAMWSLDTDYDNRSLMPHQVFFPMAGAKDGWNRLRRTVRAELDEDLLSGFHGTVSLPFEAGEHRRIAVKIVDDRGIESLKIIRLDD